MKRHSWVFIFMLIISSVQLPAYAQNQNEIRGVVKDAVTQETLIGVSVVVENTQTGTTTDANGSFSIHVENSNTSRLRFTYVGYKMSVVEVEGKNYLSVSLSEESKLINEVVVVGYATQKKESVVGAIASISNKRIVNIPVTNISQALAGKLPGLQVVQTNGEVGRDEATLYIRGMGTYNNSSPLILVDGIVRENFSQIDPNEIQSINILKDASATAVFGVKGANGVIIVTTRRGEQGKPKVSFSSQLAINKPGRILHPLGAYKAAVLKNIHQYARYMNDDYTALDLMKYRTGSSPFTHPDVDWVDEVIKDFSTMQQYNLNVNGGNNFLKYFVSGGYLTQDGFYKYDQDTRFNRYNFRSNLDFAISPRFSFSFNLGTRIENRSYSAKTWYRSEIYNAAFRTAGRNKPIYNPDGSLAGSSTQTNLIGSIRDSGTYRQTKSVVEMSLNTNYKLDYITKGLSARAQLAFDNTGYNQKMWERKFAVYDYNFDKDEYQTIGEDTYLNFSWGGGYYDQKMYVEAGLDYARTFGKHSLTGLLLANRNSRIIKQYIVYADQGVVGRLTYDYDRRYFGEVNVGYNGSENFRKGKRYDAFPSFAAGWMISNESFIADQKISDVLSLLKLRASLGWVGNDRLSGDIASDAYQDSRFSYVQSYNNEGGATFGVGDNGNPGIRQGNVANVEVTWEKARKINIGIESSLWNDLLGFNVDLFHEYRDNILSNINSIVPSYVGATFKDANFGKVENKGIEISLNHRNTVGKVEYYVQSNFSYTRNKIIQKMDPAGLQDYQKEAGYAIGTPLLYYYLGKFQDYNEIYQSPTQLAMPGNTEVFPGDNKYLDFNGDGQVDLLDRFRQGYGTVPEIQYGVTIGVNYRRFDASVLFQGSAHAQFPKNWEIMNHFSNNDNVYERHWNYWTPEMAGQEEYMRIYGKYQNNEGSSMNNYGNGDYVRLKNLVIGYSLPQKFCTKLTLSSVRLYFAGNNLFLWAAEPTLDPDNRDNRGSLMPQTIAFNFGLNINF